jgi:hypothetical protein
MSYVTKRADSDVYQFPYRTPAKVLAKLKGKTLLISLHSFGMNAASRTALRNLGRLGSLPAISAVLPAHFLKLILVHP